MDRFVLKSFVMVFAGAFCICLFVFMMQFTWRYVDELIGKGLSLEILGQFFWYMGITLVPMSLPLAILLASLISFGNMGERLELLAMKAAGVPLVRIMAPLIVLSTLMGGVSFYFQNYTSPRAQVQLRTLLYSMKQQSPAVEIPEGVFYNGVPNVNLYVQQKNPETGMLYQLIIYKTDQGFDRAQIVLADSGKLEITADQRFLKLQLWSGEQFENLQQQNLSALQNSSVPYDRETFCYKNLLISFDSKFNMQDARDWTNMPSAKSLWQINRSVDSISHKLDSVGHAFFGDARKNFFDRALLQKPDIAKAQDRARHSAVSFDELVAKMPMDKKASAISMASSSVGSVCSDLQWKSQLTGDINHDIRLHQVEWHQKITLSLACLIFFFIGAPLGAIIRKGGLGMPTVISVIIFIFYYIINTSSMKMARDGSMNMVLGMWMSSIVLTPLGLFLTYKSNNDSVVFNLEAYVLTFRRILGLRTRRHVFAKEVIIENPHYATLPRRLNELKETCRDYNRRSSLLKAPNYFKAFFRYEEDKEVESIEQQMESIVTELSNTRDMQVLTEINKLPILFSHAHVTPLHNRRFNVTAGVIFPVGLVLWLRMWRFRLRLLKDLKQITKICDVLNENIARINNEKK